MNKRIPHADFVNAYKESFGQEGAENLIKNTLSKIKILERADYSKEEALKICDALKERGGFVGIMAGILRSKISLFER